MGKKRASLDLTVVAGASRISATSMTNQVVIATPIIVNVEHDETKVDENARVKVKEVQKSIDGLTDVERDEEGESSTRVRPGANGCQVKIPSLAMRWRDKGVDQTCMDGSGADGLVRPLTSCIKTSIRMGDCEGATAPITCRNSTMSPICRATG